MDPYASFWREDLDGRGDITTKWTLKEPHAIVKARILTRQRIVVSGLSHAKAVFAQRGVKAVAKRRDGQAAPAGAVLLTLSGPAKGVLEAERLALNIIGRMSGIATTTHRLQAKVAKVNPGARVAGTRKTTPGFRAFEKEAISHGGGEPHRMGLYDAVLVKDNHLALIPDLEAALRRVRRLARGTLVEVEVTTLRQTRVAALHADWLLIDNRTPAQARRLADAARRLNPKIRIEISGGLNERTLAKYAAFADRLSLGRLTHSATSADVTLDMLGKP
jgi:nicotinate-nucleotide pyrophosphorylase (carboxylating)